MLIQPKPTGGDMNRVAKVIVLIISVLILSNSVISCNGKQVVEKQTEYHRKRKIYIYPYRRKGIHIRWIFQEVL